MSIAATIQVTKIETKPTKTGGTVFKVFDQAGNDYATFDAGIGNIASGYQGKAADITFTEKQVDKDGRTYTNRYLDSITEATAPVPAHDPATGAADWDMIGLRKTRCALWVAFLGSPLAESIGAKAMETGGFQSTAIYQAGRALVKEAEGDIFTRPPATKDDGIPF